MNGETSVVVIHFIHDPTDHHSDHLLSVKNLRCFSPNRPVSGIHVFGLIPKLTTVRVVSEEGATGEDIIPCRLGAP